MARKSLKSKTVLVLVGTRKGLFLFSSKDRKSWKASGPFLKGKDVSHAIYDTRTDRLFATSNDAWFGSELVWSDNLGKKWNSAKKNPLFTKASGLKLEKLWHIEPGPISKPDLLYAGVAPAALFRSEDRGKTWHEIESLSRHPTRPRWHPGGGGLCLHSIVPDPFNVNRVYVGISAVGVFRSDDNCKTWNTANRGTRAEFLPQKYPEYGQCVHKLLLSPGSKMLYQQNHCGVYRSSNLGESWQEITKGLPSDFGFPLGVHPHDANTIYVLPLQGAEFRCTPDGKLRVYRTNNSGKSWKALTKGLPQHEAFCTVLREGMGVDHLDPAGIYFGTSNGKVFFSRDDGDAWHLLADNLPAVLSVSVSVLD